MNKITKALLTAGAATVFGVGAAVAGTTTAEAAPSSCAMAQMKADQAFQTSQYYLGLGNYYQGAGLTSLANQNYGYSRQWTMN